jgi:anti-sigma factor RsiW
MLDDSHVFESLPAYALGSLDEDEARLVAAHLSGCYVCRRELSTFQQIADQLPLAVPAARPGDSLKARLMSQIESPKVRKPTQIADRSSLKRLLPLGVSLGLLLILVLAFSNFLLWKNLNNLYVFTGPLGMRAIALQNTDSARAASGFVIMGADGENGVLVVDQLPHLDATREYQVWLERDSAVTGSAVFSVDASGYRGVRLTAPVSLLEYSSIWVTIEPAGGSTKPTGAEVLTGSLFNR